MAELPKDVLSVSSAFPFYVSGRIRSFDSSLCKRMKLPGLKSRVSFGLPGFAGLPTLRSGRHSSPGLKAWGFLAGFINRRMNLAETQSVEFVI